MAFRKIINWLTGREDTTADAPNAPDTPDAPSQETAQDAAPSDAAPQRPRRDFRDDRGGRNRSRNFRGNDRGDRNDRDRGDRRPRFDRENGGERGAPPDESNIVPAPIPPELLPAAGDPFSVVITTPHEVPSEVEIAIELFEAGLTRFHLRKSDWPLGKFHRWVEQLPEKYHNRLVLHAEPKVVREHHLGGLHVRSNSYRPRNWPADIPVSHSCHSFQNLTDFARNAAYATIGPVFASVSKRGYEPQRTVEEFVEILNQWKARENAAPLLALGGITHENISKVRTLGFDGFAVVGSVWDVDDPVAGFTELLTNWRNA